MRKYHNKKTEIDGTFFDSLAEGRRYQELKLLDKAGEIKFLATHPRYPLVVNGIKVGTYVADFLYEVPGNVCKTVEDVKGVKTAVYQIKKKLMLACYGIEIVEVKA